MSKRQSPTTVLFRTSLTRTSTQYELCRLCFLPISVIQEAFLPSPWQSPVLLWLKCGTVLLTWPLCIMGSWSELTHRKNKTKEKTQSLEISELFLISYRRGKFVMTLRNTRNNWIISDFSQTFIIICGVCDSLCI